jgi:hypothetical protein
MKQTNKTQCYRKDFKMMNFICSLSLLEIYFISIAVLRVLLHFDLHNLLQWRLNIFDMAVILHTNSRKTNAKLQ